MKKIQWDDGLSVGVKKLDKDHKHLIDLVNQLISLIDQHEDVETIHNLVDKLEKFTLQHNQREEALIRKCDPKFLEEHRSGHDDFCLSVADFRSLLSEDSPEKDEALIEMAEYFVRWLIDHIIEQDLNLEPLFRVHGMNDIASDIDSEPSSPFFQRISFIRGLEVLVLISLLPMFVFSVMLNLGVWKRVEEAQSVIALASFSQVAGNVIHELQKERGTTAGWLASEGREFETELTDQRVLSDQQILQFKNMTATLLEDNVYPDIVFSAEKIVNATERIKSHRELIDHSTLTTDQAAAFYTDLITRLIEISQKTSSITLDPGVQKALTAYALLVSYKEAAGKERAIGAIAFARRGLNEREYLQFVGLIAQQDTLWGSIRTILTGSQNHEWHKRLDNINAEEHSRLRSIVFQSGIRALKTGIRSTYWFETATKRINQMHGFERWLITQLLADARKKADFNTALFVITMFASWTVIILIGFSSLQLTRSIRLPIMSLTSAMKALMVSDKTVRVPFLERRDELGDMVRAYESFRRKLIRTDMLSTHQELGKLVSSRHALELRRTTELGEKYRRLASIDRLTGVLNRGEFYSRSKAEISRARRHGSIFSILLLDLDHFKNINDTYGHAMGDEVLKRFARDTSLLLRDQDLFGRVGGEEFAVLLIETDLSSAGITAERICRMVNQMECHLVDETINISVSVGVSEYNLGEEDINPTMERADKALYHAKSSGRNQVKVYPLDMPKQLVNS